MAWEPEFDVNEAVNTLPQIIGHVDDQAVRDKYKNVPHCCVICAGECHIAIYLNEEVCSGRCLEKKQEKEKNGCEHRSLGTLPLG